MRGFVYFLFVIVLTLGLGACLQVRTHHTIDPIEINVNVRIEVDRELDDYFGEIDARSATMQ